LKWNGADFRAFRFTMSYPPLPTVALSRSKLPVRPAGSVPKARLPKRAPGAETQAGKISAASAGEPGIGRYD